MQPKPAGETERLRAWSPRRLWPLALIALALILFFALDLNRFVSLAALQAHQAEWRGFVQDHLIVAVLVFVAIYTTVVALSIPVAVLLTVSAGFLFGAALAFPMVVVSATLGSVLIFFAARSALATLLEAKAGPWFARLEQGFRRDQWSYMFFLRLTPVVPFFVVNVAAGLLGVDLLCYVVATFLGIMPLTLAFVLAGAGIGDVLDAGVFSLENILSPKLLLALTGIGFVAIMPVLLRRFRKKAS